MAGKYQYKKVMSPEGTLIWPHFNTPDDKFVKPDGVYHGKLAVERGPDLDEYIEKLTAERDRFVEANPKGIKSPAFGKKIADLFDVEYDDEGEETGRVIFKYKLKPFFGKENEYSQEPKLFDAHGRKYSDRPNVGNDSVAKIHGEMFPYYMESSKEVGVSLRCQNVQILELVEYTGGNDNPFGDESGDESFGGGSDGGDEPEF